MSNNHQEKFITQLLTGFACVTAGIFVIMYLVFSKPKQGGWYFWGILTAILVNIGLYLLMSGFVHKVKSDLIRRQKLREQQKTFTAE